MSWIENNRSLIKVLLLAFIFIVGYLIITDHDVATYGKVEVQHGDTLWSLAEKYKGSMSTTEWIQAVKKENNLHDDTIIAGEHLSIPILSENIYIAEKEQESEKTFIKIASNDK